MSHDSLQRCISPVSASPRHGPKRFETANSGIINVPYMNSRIAGPLVANASRYVGVPLAHSATKKHQDDSK